MKNLELWDSVSKTNPAHTKKAKIGMMNITAVCPQYQRKAATEVFGPYGTGWGVKGDKYETVFSVVSLAKDTRNRRIFASSRSLNSISLELQTGDLDSGFDFELCNGRCNRVTIVHRNSDFVANLACIVEHQRGDD